MALKINNVKKITSEDGTVKYLTTLTGEEILKLNSEKLLNYNFNTQRGFTALKKNDGEVIKLPLVNKKHVEEITESMMKGKFFESTIILNSANLSEAIHIVRDNKSNGDIVDMEIRSPLDILDGAHRRDALVAFNRRDLNAHADIEDYVPRVRNLNFPVEITGLPDEIAAKKFHQLTLGKKISNSRAEYFNIDDKANFVVKSLMEKDKSLYNRVEISKNAIGAKDTYKLTTFNTLVLALREFGKVDMMSDEELKIYTEYLDKFFTELLAIHSNNLSWREKHNVIDKNSKIFTFTNLAFYGYISLATELFNRHVDEFKKAEYGFIVAAMKLIKEISLRVDDDAWNSIVVTKENNKKEIVFSIPNNTKTRRAFSALYVLEYKKLLEPQRENNEEQRDDS